MDPFLAQVIMFGGNFAPRGWAFCDGQLLPISQYSALFSLLGTIYGGDGRTTFALPDLRGRSPVHAGNGPGLSQRRLGENGGTETDNFLPAHTHTVNARANPGDETSPVGSFLATSAGGAGDIYSTDPSTGTMAATMINSAGSAGSGNNMHPWLAINFIIALQGTFPSRN